MDEDQAAYVHIANAQSLDGTTPSMQLTSSFEITLTSRGDTAVILWKKERGKDAILRKKTCGKVVKVLKTEISAGDINRILTSTNADKYDVANKAISYQAIMNSIHCFCIQYDPDSLLKILANVDLSQPLQVAKATRFLNAIGDWQQLNDKRYFEWQEFIIRYGTKDKLEGNRWLEDTLLISMNKQL
jgi:hypothetical protein